MIIKWQGLLRHHSEVKGTQRVLRRAHCCPVEGFGPLCFQVMLSKATELNALCCVLVLRTALPAAATPQQPGRQHGNKPNSGTQSGRTRLHLSPNTKQRRMGLGRKAGWTGTTKSPVPPPLLARGHLVSPPCAHQAPPASGGGRPIKKSLKIQASRHLFGKSELQETAPQGR